MGNLEFYLSLMLQSLHYRQQVKPVYLYHRQILVKHELVM